MDSIRNQVFPSQRRRARGIFYFNRLDKGVIVLCVVVSLLVVKVSSLFIGLIVFALLVASLTLHRRFDYHRGDHLELRIRNRLNFLRNSNLRRHSLFLFVGLADRMSHRDFQKFSEQEYRRRVGELEKVSKKATSVFNSAGLGFEELGQEGVLDLYYRLLNPTKKTRPSYQRREELFSEEAIRAEPYLKVQTIREHLIGTEIAWDSSNLRIGDRLHQVFTLEKLPPNTEFTDAELFYELDFDCLLVASFAAARFFQVR